MKRGTRRAKAHKVRRLGDGHGGKRSWLFYLENGETVYLGSSKLLQMTDDFAVNFLMNMEQRENRAFHTPVELYLVRGRKKGSWLVHRIDGSAGMMRPAITKKML